MRLGLEWGRGYLLTSDDIVSRDLSVELGSHPPGAIVLMRLRL
jgi:hypothetical protein